jgi:hypothetical protein
MNAIRALARKAEALACALLVAGAVGAGGLAPGAAFAQKPGAFDHLRTGFPLSGAHQAVRCDSCHQRGVFKGTPTRCAACHTVGSRVASVVMPKNHIPVTQPCESCHNTSTFAGARFTHVGIAPGTCATCHNGSQAPGKPAGHVVTSLSCDACHRTSSYRPAFFNHASVIPGSCASCHNGTSARGKTTNHVVTTASCDTCHRTTAWLPATFSHTGVVAGTCATCHNGTSARGKPTSHFITTRECDACHATTAWLPVRPYTHVSPFYRPHNSGVTCASCHKSNSEVATWTFAAYKPDCAGCHAANFKPGSHKKVDSPQILYTVAELKDCSGSCHTYTNSTFTTIQRARTGKHRSTDGGF